jgi:DNA-binding protein HU-beta
MNKNDLVVAVANNAGLAKTEAAAAIEAMFDVIIKALRKKDKVMLVGFGTFYATKRKGGEGRNPRTGEKIKISPSTQAKFKAGKALKDALN